MEKNIEIQEESPAKVAYDLLGIFYGSYPSQFNGVEGIREFAQQKINAAQALLDSLTDEVKFEDLLGLENSDESGWEEI